MATFTLDILDKNASILHSENYPQLARKNDIEQYLHSRGRQLLENTKSLGVHGNKPASYRIRVKR